MAADMIGKYSVRIKVTINKREAAASGLLCLLGLAAVLQVSASSVGRAAGLGGGFLPVLVGTVFMFVGVLWLFDSRLSPDDDEDADIGASKWRGSCGLASGLFAFLLLARYAGLLPAIFSFVFLTVLGDRRHSWRSAALLASAMTAAITCIFSLVPDFPPTLPFLR